MTLKLFVVEVTKLTGSELFQKVTELLVIAEIPQDLVGAVIELAEDIIHKEILIGGNPYVKVHCN